MARQREYIKRDQSKDVLSTFSFNNETGTVYPDFELSTVLSMIDSDPVARGAFTQFVDAFMEGDYAVVERDSLRYDREFELKLDKEYNFRHNVLRGIAIQGKLFRNAFVEIIRKTDGVKALNVLDTTQIQVITKPNGDVEFYKSRVPNPENGEFPKWRKDEVVWYKFEDRQKGFATIDLKTLWETLQLKSYVKRYVAWLWKTGQYRVLYNFENASNQDIHDFLAYARRHDDNFQAPFITKGKMDNKILRDMSETDMVTALLKWCDSQILIAMRTPPIDAGIPDASGRSNADAQSNSNSTHVTSMKKVVEDITSFDLFPRLNKGNSLFRFAPNNRFEERQVWENVQIMKSVNMSEDVIREYLQDRGMFFAASKLFENPMEQMMGVQPGGSPAAEQAKEDAAPSRQASQELKKKGTGEAASTRPDQMRQ